MTFSEMEAVAEQFIQNSTVFEQIALPITLLTVGAQVYLFFRERKNTEFIHETIFTINDKFMNDDDDVSKERFDHVIDELIKAHHRQAILQSTVQFWFSLIAAVIGFLFIIAIILFTQDATWYETLIKSFPGLIIEAVSVLFFSQSKETREQGADFLNRLRQDRQFEKSIAIIETIPDEQLKSSLKGQIALHLCGITNQHATEK